MCASMDISVWMDLRRGLVINNKYMKDKIIVDLDGTIADITHRLSFINGEEKDWKGFFDACENDEPIPEMVKLIETLSVEYRIMFFTGRSERIRYKTIQWLDKHVDLADTYQLYMRQNGNYEQDYVIKKQMLEDSNKLIQGDIAFALEDRTQVVEMYRAEGIRCLQCDNNNF